jgi:hypothetical protein
MGGRPWLLDLTSMYLNLGSTVMSLDELESKDACHRLLDRNNNDIKLCSFEMF